MAGLPRGYRDLHEHIAALEAAGLLRRVSREIDKDSELHPLVRWQFRGGIPERERRAWLFDNVVDARGRRYAMPVLVAGLAGSQQIYATGLDCEPSEIADRWREALASPVEPVIVDSGPVHDVVHLGDNLLVHGGLDEFPVPISTPGFDNAPYLTASHWVTRDPDTGIRNVGTYRGQLKSPTKVGLYLAPRQHGRLHLQRYRERGERMPAAIVLGAPPVVSYAAVTKVPLGVDELKIAGGLARAPIQLVKCCTIDLEVPADAEIVIEGYVRTDLVEPEGPFGESHGYVNPETLSPWLEVTAVTHRSNPVLVSVMSQVTPSESSALKKAALESVYLRHLRESMSLKNVVRVGLFEPLLNLRPMVVVQLRRPTRGDVWRSLRGIASLQSGVGKLVVAVDEDIDPDDAEAILWAICYRARPDMDVEVGRGSERWHGPPFVEDTDREGERRDYYGYRADAVLLIDAVLKEPFPPVSLPKREYMEHARAIWEELGLPPITPRSPWFGYSLGDWRDAWDDEAEIAVQGRYYETGDRQAERQQPPRD